MKLKQRLESIPVLSDRISRLLPRMKPILEGSRFVASRKCMKKRRRKVLIDKALTAVAAFIASNPNYFRSKTIELAKKRCIVAAICHPEYGDWDEEGRCRFTVYRLQEEGGQYHSALKDYRVAKRHLEAEYAVGELGKEIEKLPNGRAKTVYVYESTEKLSGLQLLEAEL